jgi:hypothetical protein
MRIVLLMIVSVAVVSCGGRNRGTERVVPYDPELLELCDQTARSATELVCVHENDAQGKKIWSSIVSPSRMMEMFLVVNAQDSNAGRTLASNLVFRGENSNEKGLSCEGQIARYERGVSYFDDGLYREAFLDFAFIVKSGPHHFKYEEMKVVLKKLRPIMAAGTVSTCLAEIYNR